MKKYQEILFSITAVVMTLATALPAAAAQIDQLAPVKIMGTVVEKTEDTLTVSQQLSGSYPGEYILHISEETKILDSSSGMPVSAENINQGAAICAYGGGAVTASIPPSDYWADDFDKYSGGWGRAFLHPDGILCSKKRWI